MADIFKHWSPGDRFQVSAEFMNVLTEMARDYSRRKGPRAGKVVFDKEQEIWVKNTSQTDRNQYSIVRLGTKRRTPDVDQTYFFGKGVFEIAAPDEETPFAILQDPCPRAGGLVRALIGGWSWARLMLNSASHDWADPITGEYQFLTTTTTGQARILWRDDAPVSPPATTLSQSAAPDDMTLHVVATEGWDVAVSDFIVTIESEQVLISVVDEGTWTVKERGYNGTTAATHANGSAVTLTAATVWALVGWDVRGDTIAAEGPCQGESYYRPVQRHLQHVNQGGVVIPTPTTGGSAYTAFNPGKVYPVVTTIELTINADGGTFGLQLREKCFPSATPSAIQLFVYCDTGADWYIEINDTVGGFESDNFTAPAVPGSFRLVVTDDGSELTVDFYSLPGETLLSSLTMASTDGADQEGVHVYFTQDISNLSPAGEATLFKVTNNGVTVWNDAFLAPAYDYYPMQNWNPPTGTANYDGWPISFYGLFGYLNLTTQAPYTPAVDANWTNPDPTNVQDALDRLAAAVAGLLGGGIP